MAIQRTQPRQFSAMRVFVTTTLFGAAASLLGATAASAQAHGDMIKFALPQGS